MREMRAMSHGLISHGTPLYYLQNQSFICYVKSSLYMSVIHCVIQLIDASYSLIAYGVSFCEAQPCPMAEIGLANRDSKIRLDKQRQPWELDSSNRLLTRIFTIATHSIYNAHNNYDSKLHL